MKTSIQKIPYRWVAGLAITLALVFTISALAMSPAFADHDNGHNKCASQGNKYGHQKKRRKHEVHRVYRPNPPPVYRYALPVYVPPPVYYPPQQPPGVNLFFPFPAHQ
ncbi:MAG: hypothetical protein NTV43_16950 [Methylococcales bacterium]|nr:hypothetical protein [Methylococcales bacterium]